MMDYSFQKYEELCRAIVDAGYATPTMREHLSGNSERRFVLLRHDIDHTMLPALDMARMENELGITSTYYVRYKEHVMDPGLMRQIEDLGHEIGYHYETLDKGEGNFGLAIKIFADELETMRQHARIDTIAMHGNPLSPYNNRDLWTQYSFRDYNILGEAYLSVDFAEVCYFSDSGRSWDERYKIHDTSSDGRKVRISHTDEIISIVRNGEIDKMYILVHPIIWTKSLPLWYRELVRLNIIKVGKILIRQQRTLTSLQREYARSLK
jgi:hypothetical protein